MTIPVLVALGLGAGAGVAKLSLRPLAGVPSVIRTRYFVVALAFGALLVLAGMPLYVTYADWSLMYLANPAHLPWPLVAGSLFVFYLSSAPLGFILAHRLLQDERTWLVRTVGVTVASLCVLFLLASWDRLTTVAYYDAFHNGLRTIPLSSSPLFTVLIVESIALVGALAFTFRSLGRHRDQLEEVPTQGDRTRRSARPGGGAVESRPLPLPPPSPVAFSGLSPASPTSTAASAPPALVASPAMPGAFTRRGDR
ncbi:MAG: hypothetical protein IPK13_05105 [Deltaproteobacteria bacterium]|nr:hypothetical protein [Deltaproteobacteria bacterium]